MSSNTLRGGGQRPIRLHIDGRIKEDFADIRAVVRELEGVRVEKYSAELESFKSRIFDELKRRYSLEELKDMPVFKAYRSFYWRLGIDPTKTRPAGEALLRRILLGKSIPTINTLVDAYNLASAESGVAISALDREKLRGDLTLRYSRAGEQFLGMGMPSPMVLKDGLPVICDEEKIVALYPHRDSEQTKITESTKNVVLIFCGVPGIGDSLLREAADKTVSYLKMFCGGREIQQ